MKKFKPKKMQEIELTEAILEQNPIFRELGFEAGQVVTLNATDPQHPRPDKP